MKEHDLVLGFFVYEYKPRDVESLAHFDGDF